MATIVTYNRGAQGVPFTGDVPGSDAGASFSTDFMADPGWTQTDFSVLTDGLGGIYGNSDGSDASQFNSPLCIAAPSKGDKFSFGVRCGLAGGSRNANDVATIGLSDNPNASLELGNANVGFKITLGASAAADVVQVSYDDGTTDELVTITNPDGFDGTAYSVFGAVVQHLESGKTKATFYVNGEQVHELVGAGTFAANECMGLCGRQGAETSLLYLDWAGYHVSARS